MLHEVLMRALQAEDAGSARALAERLQSMDAEAVKSVLVRSLLAAGEHGGGASQRSPAPRSPGLPALAPRPPDPTCIHPVSAQAHHATAWYMAQPVGITAKEPSNSGPNAFAALASSCSQAQASAEPASVPVAKSDAVDDLLEGRERWRIPIDELALERRIGGGAMSSMYRATWEGVTVAVKVAAGCNAMAGWRKEMSTLAQLRHPNIVRCLGAVSSPPTYCLVLEYCDGGDLYKALKAPTRSGLFWDVAEGVATGMHHLHRKMILHRDLKSSNILLDTSGGVRITDFGLAKPIRGSRQKRLAAGNVEVGTLRWMAPVRARPRSWPCQRSIALSRAHELPRCFDALLSTHAHSSNRPTPCCCPCPCNHP
jgi:hypothetical protein